MTAGIKRKQSAIIGTEPQPKTSRLSAPRVIPTPTNPGRPADLKISLTPTTITTTTKHETQEEGGKEADAISDERRKHPPEQPPQSADDEVLHLINASNRTPFEKRVWTLLCQIPRGSISTYAVLSAHLGSSPRAVGNALRRNPFAPRVPCHRVIATGGTLGGFKGKWPRDGEGITIDEKRRLLRGEGVRFDASGTRVLGTPFAGFRF